MPKIHSSLHTPSGQLERCQTAGPQFIPGLASRCTHLRPPHTSQRRTSKSVSARSTLTESPQAPEIQSMYSLNIPVSRIRTKTRQEFERHRYVAQLPVVDVLLFQSHQEYQVGRITRRTGHTGRQIMRADEHSVGNPQLLEAAYTYLEVLPRRGGSKSETAAELHQRVLGGKLPCLGQRLRTAVLNLLAPGTKLSKRIPASHSVNTPIPSYFSCP